MTRKYSSPRSRAYKNKPEGSYDRSPDASLENISDSDHSTNLFEGPSEKSVDYEFLGYEDRREYPNLTHKRKPQNNRKIWPFIVLSLLALVVLSAGLFGAGYKISQLYTQFYKKGDEKVDSYQSQLIQSTISQFEKTSSDNHITKPEKEKLSKNFSKPTKQSKIVSKVPKTTFKTKKFSKHTKPTSKSKEKVSQANIASNSDDPRNDCKGNYPTAQKIKQLDSREADFFIDDRFEKTKFASPVASKDQLLRDCYECPLDKSLLITIVFWCTNVKRPDATCIRLCEPDFLAQPTKQCLNNNELKNIYGTNIDHNINHFRDFGNKIIITCMQKASLYLQHYMKEYRTNSPAVCSQLPQAVLTNIRVIMAENFNKIGCGVAL